MCARLATVCAAGAVQIGAVRVIGELPSRLPEPSHSAVYPEGAPVAALAAVLRLGANRAPLCVPDSMIDGCVGRACAAGRVQTPHGLARRRRG